MVQLNSVFLLVATFVTGVISAPAKRDVAQVESDIASISTQVTTLDNDINAFPATGGSLLNALAIHTAASNLITTIATATSDVTSTGALDESDGQTILASVQAFEPTIIDALTGIIAKKPAFDGLPIGGVSALVSQDLQSLQANTAAFENALIANAPADLVSQATNIKTAVDAAFSQAVAAYAGS